MAENIIKIKHGPGAPADGVLQENELGFDTTNGVLYIGKNGSSFSVGGNSFLRLTGGTVSGAVTFMSGNTHNGIDTYNATGGIINNGSFTQNTQASFTNGMIAGSQNTFEKIKVVGKSELQGELVTSGAVHGTTASLFGNDAEISSGADLNNYKECGTWSITNNTIAASLFNCPSTTGGSLIVRDGNARGRTTAQTYCYRQQIYIPFNPTMGFFIRNIISSATAGVWSYGAWKAYLPYVDCITEEGTSGDWYYRVWSSGKKELWFFREFSSVAMTTGRGAEYISGNYSVSYPSGLNFTTKAIVTTNASARASTTHPIRTYNVEATQASGLNFRFSSTASQTVPVLFSAYILFW